MPAKKTKTYSEILWSQLRSMYGSGLFASLEAMYPEAKKLYGDNTPALISIKKRATAEGWKKTLYRDRLDAAGERSFVKLFEKYEFGDEQMVKKIVDCINHGEAIVKKVLKAIENAKGELDEDKIEALEDAVQNLNITHKYIAERNKLTGSYAAAKLRDEGSGKFGIEKGPESIEEKWAEHERLLQSLQD